MVDPTIEVSVQSAEVKFKEPQSSTGKVELLTALIIDVTAPGDMVSVTFDETELISALFKSFDPSNKNPNVYKLRDMNLFVMLEFDPNLLTVIRRKLDLATLDNTNGVDVELHVGSAVALENIMLIPTHRNKLEYHSTE